jgi:hypothetical protein
MMEDASEGEQQSEEQEHVIAPARPVKVKINGPARRASERKQVGASEREGESEGGPGTRIGKLKRVQRFDPKNAKRTGGKASPAAGPSMAAVQSSSAEKDARLERFRAAVYDQYIRDRTPEGYSKA